MMSLSQTTGYAVQALVCLEFAEDRPCFIRDVAECTGLPRAYLARIINRLAHRGIVSAKRGYHGGVRLSRPPAAISLLDVVEAVEGKGWIGPCMLGIERCSRDFSCPTHKFWADIGGRIETVLRTTTLEAFFQAPGYKDMRKRAGAAGEQGGRGPGRALPEEETPRRARRER
jgi:Rrf2 family transcriptional regulator, iron-sulfur cluster assembly transcription factor